MNRGPIPGRRPELRPWIDKARDAHGMLPEWIEALALAADAQGLTATAKLVRYSPSTLSTVLNGKYAGDLSRVENAVSGALQGVTVMCPVLGEIGRQQCERHQRAPKTVSNSSSLRLHRACRSGCPNAHLQGGRDVE